MYIQQARTVDGGQLDNARYREGHSHLVSVFQIQLINLAEDLLWHRPGPREIMSHEGICSSCSQRTGWHVRLRPGTSGGAKTEVSPKDAPACPHWQLWSSSA